MARLVRGRGRAGEGLRLRRLDNHSLYPREAQAYPFRHLRRRPSRQVRRKKGRASTTSETKHPCTALLPARTTIIMVQHRRRRTCIILELPPLPPMLNRVTTRIHSQNSGKRFACQTDALYSSITKRRRLPGMTLGIPIDNHLPRICTLLPRRGQHGSWLALPMSPLVILRFTAQPRSQNFSRKVTHSIRLVIFI